MENASLEETDYQNQKRRLELLRERFRNQHQPSQDPLMPPNWNIYAPSGLDVMNMLLLMRARPTATALVGNVDTNVALVIADADLPDHPIVYWTEPFSKLTGYYDHHDLVGKNCRFLQYPPHGTPPRNDILHNNAEQRRKIRESIKNVEDLRVELVNYKKDGTPFRNCLTIVPLTYENKDRPDEPPKHYILGFQADAGTWRFG